MAKQDETTQVYDVSDVLRQLPQLPSVYDAKEFTNRAFVLNSIDWKDFPASQRNNYNATRKLIMNVTTLDNSKTCILETTQKGLVEPIKALADAGYIPCRLMIVKEGKFCTVVSV